MHILNLALCGIAWVAKRHFPACKIDHADEVVQIPITSRTALCELDFAVDPFQNAVRDACFDKIHNARPMRSDCFGEGHEGWDFGRLDFVAPLFRERE